VTDLPLHRGALGGEDLAALRTWTTEVQAWPPGSHRFGHYAERTSAGEVVCRTENVSACHDGVAGLVRGPLAALVRSALGEDVVDFKDKINYKQPGGAGFGAHQDLLAYPGVARVLSILVAVDECSRASGCVWLATGVDRLLPTDERGVVAEDAASSLSWAPAELAPGDAVLLDGLAPHYSEANRSTAQRRVLVASYAPVSEGYVRDDYYSARARSMGDASARDHRFRISTLADFEGIEVAGDEGPTAAGCWHETSGAPA
jgi:Phytanoyl-CoA dioxygenase (PhyH)